MNLRLNRLNLAAFAQAKFLSASIKKKKKKSKELMQIFSWSGALVLDRAS